MKDDAVVVGTEERHRVLQLLRERDRSRLAVNRRAHVIGAGNGGLSASTAAILQEHTHAQQAVGSECLHCIFGRAAARATEGYRRETCVTDDLDRSRARLLTGDMDIGNSHRPPGVTVDELGAFRERVTARIDLLRKRQG